MFAVALFFRRHFWWPIYDAFWTAYYRVQIALLKLTPWYWKDLAEFWRDQAQQLTKSANDAWQEVWEVEEHLIETEQELLQAAIRITDLEDELQGLPPRAVHQLPLEEGRSVLFFDEDGMPIGEHIDAAMLDDEYSKIEDKFSGVIDWDQARGFDEDDDRY